MWRQARRSRSARSGRIVRRGCFIRFVVVRRAVEDDVVVEGESEGGPQAEADDVCGDHVGERRGQPDLWRRYTEVATLGTISDMMLLEGENRALVADGIAQMRQTRRPGIVALAATSGVDLSSITADELPFSLIPRLNAAGRMGTTDVAFISLGGVVTSESIRVAGDAFDEDIISYVKREFNLLIGERTSEDIKLRVGAAYTSARREQMEIRGRDLLSGLPKPVTISTAQASAAIEPSVMRIIDCVKKVLEETPPELAADIMDRGIVLTGGGALLYGMAELIQRETGTPTVVADEPMSCVALGCGKALDVFDKFDGKATNTTFGRKK